MIDKDIVNNVTQFCNTLPIFVAESTKLKASFCILGIIQADSRVMSEKQILLKKPPELALMYTGVLGESVP